MQQDLIVACVCTVRYIVIAVVCNLDHTATWPRPQAPRRGLVHSLRMRVISPVLGGFVK